MNRWDGSSSHWGKLLDPLARPTRCNGSRRAVRLPIPCFLQRCPRHPCCNLPSATTMTSSQPHRVSLFQKLSNPLHVRTPESNMCTRSTENPIPVKQRYPDTTEQQSIHSYSGNRRPHNASPIFPGHRPRRKPTGQICRLHQSRNVMSFPHVINTVLGCTLPDSIPGHRAPGTATAVPNPCGSRQHVCPDSAECTCHRMYTIRNVWNQNAPCTPCASGQAQTDIGP